MRVDGSILREARKRAGLSQRALAERAGTAQSVIARIELGRVSPTLATIEIANMSRLDVAARRA